MSRKTKRYAEIRRLILKGREDAAKVVQGKSRKGAEHRLVDYSIYEEAFRKAKKAAKKNK